MGIEALLRSIANNGPATAIMAGYDVEIGGKINNMTVIAQSSDGPIVCASRSKDVCRVCVSSGKAAEENCQKPITS